jgi:hypothetical protein
LQPGASEARHYFRDDSLERIIHYFPILPDWIAAIFIRNFLKELDDFTKKYEMRPEIILQKASEIARITRYSRLSTNC